jgi:hypothetical protein
MLPDGICHIAQELFVGVAKIEFTPWRVIVHVIYSDMDTFLGTDGNSGIEASLGPDLPRESIMEALILGQVGHNKNRQ